MSFILSRSYIFWALLFCVSMGTQFTHAESLTWGDVHRKVLSDNLTIKAAGLQSAAGAALARQAGGLAPSKLSVELENFGASGELKSQDPLETTFEVAQELDISGKRGATIKAGLYSSRVAAMDHELVIKRTVAEARQAFAGVLAAKERKKLAEESAQLAASLLDTMRKKSDAGKVAPLEAERADIEHSISQVESQKAERQVRSVLGRLAVICGVTNAVGLDVAGKISNLAEGAGLSENSSLDLIEKHPEFLKAEAIVGHKKAELSIARSKYIPSIELAGGIRQFESSGDSAYVASIGLNMPLFSRNGRAVDAAKSECLAAELSRDAVRMNLMNQYRALVLDLDAAKQQVKMLQGKAIPAAERAYAAAEEGYKQGKFGYLDLLEARRAMLNTRSMYIDAWLEHEVLASELEVFGRGAVN